MALNTTCVAALVVVERMLIRFEGGGEVLGVQILDFNRMSSDLERDDGNLPQSRKKLSFRG